MSNLLARNDDKRYSIVVGVNEHEKEQDDDDDDGLST